MVKVCNHGEMAMGASLSSRWRYLQYDELTTQSALGYVAISKVNKVV